MEKVYIKTHGCSNNLSESEIMAGILRKDGFEIVDDPSSADVLIVNVCTVKGEVIALRSVRQLHEEFPYKKIVVAGCLTKELIKEIQGFCEGAGFLSTHNIEQIREIVEETINDNPIQVLAKGKKEKIGLPKKRINPVVGIVPISSGCNQGCAYCSVIGIKGRLKSYPEELVLAEVRRCLEDGCKEIWVTSQDNGNYGTDKGESKLCELLSKIILLEGDFKVRIGMINPTFLKGMVDDMVKILNHPKMFKFLHIPVQSGSDAILESMGRGYSVEEFKEIVSKIRSGVENVTIATDIIVGFPGETDDQFKESADMMKEIKPDVLNISRFIPRPGTKAYDLGGRVDGGNMKERSGYLTKIYEWIAYGNNKKWLGWEGEMIIDEKGKEGTMIGRNDSYKPVVVSGDHSIGQKVRVRVDNFTQWDLRGVELQKL